MNRGIALHTYIRRICPIVHYIRYLSSMIPSQAVMRCCVLQERLGQRMHECGSPSWIGSHGNYPGHRPARAKMLSAHGWVFPVSMNEMIVPRE